MKDDLKVVGVAVMEGVGEWVVHGPDCSAILTPAIATARDKLVAGWDSGINNPDLYLGRSLTLAPPKNQKIRCAVS